MQDVSVVIVLAPGFEEMEAVIIADICRRGGLSVDIAGLGEGPITGSRGVVIVPDIGWEQRHPAPMSVLVLPGGAGGVQALGHSGSLRRVLLQRHEAQLPIAALCAAPALLAELGVLAGRRVTAYPGTLDPHETSYTLVDAPVVEDGHLLTGKGPGAAMDFALALISRCVNADRALAVAETLQRIG